MNNKRLYNIWSCMKQRCFNPKHTAARWYHDKGIRVCEEWMSFDKFQRWALDNGYSDNLTIDRIDSEGNYEPSNCRWISLKENVKRRSKSAVKGKRKAKVKVKGGYEIVYRVQMLFEVIVERGYSCSLANRRISELEKNNKTRGAYYFKRKIDKRKDVGTLYFIDVNHTNNSETVDHIMEKQKKTKAVNNMTEKQKKILDIFEKLLPKCTEKQQEKILNFGEAIAYMVEHQDQKTEKTA